MATPPTPEIKAQLLREEALEALAKAHPIAVQFCRRAEVDYRPEITDSPPHINYTASFRKRDYIHFKLQYSDDWWIGRVVGDRRGLFFIPSEDKLKLVTMEIRMMEGGTKSSLDELEVYRRAPITRPIVFMGPSGKTSRLTELLQKPLISFMKERFSGRLVTLKPDFSVSYNMSTEHARRLRSEVFAAGTSMNLVLLDCDASSPEDLKPANIHAQIIYIQIARQKVLHKLIQEMTANSRERYDRLQQAYHLYENSVSKQHCYSLIISESNVDDACLTLELFLESYWAFTRSVILVNTLKLAKKTTPEPRPKLTAQTTIDASIDLKT